MSKRRSPQDHVLDFFLEHPLEECAITLNAVRRILFNRQYGGEKDVIAAPSKPKRKRRTKAEIAAAKEETNA